MVRRARNTLIAIGIPTIYAMALRMFFGVDSWNELFSVMSLTFLFLLPTIVGALTVYLSKPAQAKSTAYRIFMPWVPVFLFLIMTLAMAIEGWACWLMILPLFLLAASVGGVVGGFLKNRKANSKLNISILALLPFLLGPMESLIDMVPGTYMAYTSIEIDAPAEKIWNNVTRVGEISLDEDNGYLSRILGFPRPVRAELDFEGVGAYREAVFTKGLVFHETVTEYKDNEKMVFTIKAYSDEILSTTLDEHVVIGGDYFDVLEGTYELEELTDGRCRLHLYSYFKMNTTFNFYAGWWGTLIMKDIQNNILQVQKGRSELQ